MLVCSVAVGKTKKPHIVFIIADDLVSELVLTLKYQASTTLKMSVRPNICLSVRPPFGLSVCLSALILFVGLQVNFVGPASLQINIKY